MVPRRSRVLLVLSLVTAVLGSVAGCGPDEPKPSPPLPYARSTPKTVTFTQIEIDYRPSSRPWVARSKDEAREFAKALVARIRLGESMESLVAQYTDDRMDDREDGKPFNSGSYSKAKNQIANEAMRNAVFALDVGQLAAEPVDSGLAYHVIRRDL